MKKAAIFLAEGFEENEGLIVVDILRRAGIQIDMVSVTGELTVTSSHKVKIVADVLFEDWNEDVDFMILPGGMPGTKNLRAHKGLCDKLLSHYEKGGCLAAVCAAPSVLGQLGLLKGKKAVCYPGFEEQLLDADVVFEEVAVDGNVITSRGLGTTIPFALAILEKMTDKTTADEIKAKIIFKQ